MKMPSLVFSSSAENFCALADKYNTLDQSQSATLAVHAQSGDRQAMQTLVCGHLYMVCLIANKLGYCLPKSDLYQEGVLALYKAIECYDSTKGSFYGHALQWVRYYMEKALAAYGYAVRISEEKMKRIMKINHAQSDYMLENGFEASPEELAVMTGYELSEVKSLLSCSTCSLDENHSEQLDGFYNPWAAELQAADSADELISRRELGELVDWLADEREAYIIRSLYGIGCLQKDTNMLAAELQLTPQRICQIRQSAIDKFRRRSDLFYIGVA